MATLYDYIAQNRTQNIGTMMQQMKMQEALAARQQRQKQQATIGQLVQGIQDPQMRAVAEAFPEMYAKQKVEKAFAEPKQPKMLQDAQGRWRYAEGPQMGQVVPGFEQGKAPEGFERGPDGRLVAIPEYWEQKKAVSRSGAAKITNNVGPSGVDYGDPPKEMSWARDESGKIVLDRDPQTGFMRPVAVPVFGGKVDRESKEGERKQGELDAQRKVYADVVTTDVDRAVREIQSGVIPRAGVGALLSGVPGTPQKNVSSLIDTVKANVGFDRLQQMRAASPTGGALGQVSDFENRLLQATIGNLDQAQSEDQLLYNLKRVKNAYLDAVHGTPEQIRKLAAEGKIDAQTAEELSRREPLSSIGGKVPQRPRAKNPQTGEVIEWNGTQWVPVK